MKSQFNRSIIGLGLIFTAWAQTSNVGSVSVAVLDPAGAMVPGAQLQLRDIETNDIRKAETQANGTYSFPNLSFGIYRLTVTKPGFETEVFQSVLRQRPTHGAQFNVNYTWAHSLGIAAQNGIQGEGNNIYYTQRNFRLNYGPSLFDIRHVVHASGTYDLPFGKGKPFLSQNKLANYTVGGWTLGTIVVIQSGNPFQFNNGFNTFNNTDSGVNLNGLTVADLQKSIGVFRTGNPWVDLIDPKFIGANGAANGALISPNNVAGSFGFRPYVYGPGWYNIDLSVNKTIPIRESVRFTFQAEFLNATNHPTFTFNTGNPPNTVPNSLSVQSTSFGQNANGNAFSAARRIEFRANIEF